MLGLSFLLKLIFSTFMCLEEDKQKVVSVGSLVAHVYWLAALLKVQNN